MMRKCLYFAVISSCLVPSLGSAQTVDWSSAFRFRTTGGFQNPGVYVGFNPQPEPPAYLVAPEIDLSESTQLRMTIPDIAVSEGGAQILFAVPEGFEFDAEGEPDGEVFSFQANGPSPINIQFTMTTGSGGISSPGSWVAFNPQPEPPAGFHSIGFEFEFTSNSPATLVVEILDDGVEQLGFELLQSADFDTDGDVDDVDLGFWTEHYSSTDGGDSNLNGITEGDDFLRWQRQYTGPAGVVAVPEPGCLAILVLGLASLVMLRQPRNEPCE